MLSRCRAHEIVRAEGGSRVATHESGTGKVLLRDVAGGDLPMFFEHQRDPAANRMAGFPPRDRDAFLAHWKKVLADGNIIKKTILFDGRVAGNVVSFENRGEREVGYWIGREYWGRGVATEALSVPRPCGGASSPVRGGRRAQRRFHPRPEKARFHYRRRGGRRVRLSVGPGLSVRRERIPTFPTRPDHVAAWVLHETCG
jgi:hypothetical protein